jgi:membrane-associated protease RseP (regulator of RpoE activity)
VDPKLAAEEARKQRELALQSLMTYQQRLSAAAYGALTGGAQFCGTNVRPVAGTVAANQYLDDPETNAIAGRLFELDGRLKLISVFDNSPAAKAGLRHGDVLLSVGGTAVPQGPGALSQFDKIFEKSLRVGTPTPHVVLRGNTEITATVIPEAACNVPVRVVRSDALNAFADGDSIFVTSGMVRFIENDAELAFIVAHELAHNAMGHLEAKRRNSVAGAFVDLTGDRLGAAGGAVTPGRFSQMGQAAGAHAYSEAFESEADYVALYMLAAAGTEIEQAPDVWRRVAAEHPNAIAITTTHPPTSTRFVAMEQAIREIRIKQAQALPLHPEMKSAPPTKAVSVRAPVAAPADARKSDDIDRPSEPLLIQTAMAAPLAAEKANRYVKLHWPSLQKSMKGFVRSHWDEFSNFFPVGIVALSETASITIGLRTVISVTADDVALTTWVSASEPAFSTYPILIRFDLENRPPDFPVTKAARE